METLHVISQLSNLVGAILMGLSIGKDEKERVEDERCCKGGEYTPSYCGTLIFC